MKLTAIDGKIYLQADFKNITENERRFMSKSYFDGVRFGKICNDIAPLQIKEIAELCEVNLIYCFLVKHADLNGVEIDESAKAVVDATERAVEEYLRKESEIRELRRLVEVAQNKMRNGCVLCEHLKFDRGYMCKHTCKKCRFKADEVEMEYEAWKEAKALGIKQSFYARPFPMPGCAVIEEGHAAFLKLQEMNEN